MTKFDLFEFLFGDGTVDIYECRACGTKLEESCEQCPECGSTDIVEYHLC